ncbi:MAG TPA: sugar phosphate isomerase/epimerase family protein [Verrucomicrobiae bacterium]|nr:sugar phosphate isomerase/epimerase family protein [Verrucomicrobiae bacterium]
MSRSDYAERLAVCSWSLQPAHPAELAARLKQTGLRRVQLALDPLRQAPATWSSAAEVLKSHQIDIVSGMFGCVGEDYSTLESIRLTGGIAPDATWEENWKNIQETAAIAQSLHLKLVTFHAGFLPHDQTDHHFATMVRRLQEVADIFERAGIVVGLETGQETAPALAQLLQALKRPNMGVNFDPANMILYGKGDPIEALHVLAKWIRQVHMKDAVPAKTRGTWGEEVPAGSGKVDWKKFFSTLSELNFRGPIVIEREAGKNRVEDIRTAKAVAERTFAQ